MTTDTSAATTTIDDLVALFRRIGLPENKCKESASNKKFGPALGTLIREVGMSVCAGVKYPSVMDAIDARFTSIVRL